MTLQKPGDLLGAIGGVPMPPNEVVVEAAGVEKWFGRLHVLKGVSMTVKRQEVVVVIGASGSGKTTFIRCMNHLEKIQGGRIFVNGHLIGYREVGGKLVEDREKNIAKQRQEIGMVFQRFNLFPHMTALQNITEAPLLVRKTPQAEAVEMGRALAGPGRPVLQGERLPEPALGGPAAARRDRAGARHEAGAHALRRAHLGARPGDDRRGPGGHQGAGARGHDDDRRLATRWASPARSPTGS